MPDKNALIDDVFSNYDELKRDLPEPASANEPYLTVLREVEVNCILDFDSLEELGPNSKSLLINPDSGAHYHFFDLLAGFLGFEMGQFTLSLGQSPYSHLDDEFLEEFGNVEAMLVTIQEMHNFLLFRDQADLDQEYLFYIKHQDGQVRKIDTHLTENGWLFMPWVFGETPTLSHEILVTRKRKAS